MNLDLTRGGGEGPPVPDHKPSYIENYSPESLREEIQGEIRDREYKIEHGKYGSGEKAQIEEEIRQRKKRLKDLH